MWEFYLLFWVLDFSENKENADMSKAHSPTQALGIQDINHSNGIHWIEIIVMPILAQALILGALNILPF